MSDEKSEQKKPNYAEIIRVLENPMHEREIDGVDLILTCGACPEQYEARLNGVEIGYLRLRHGYFYAEYPSVGGKTVYETGQVKGDGQFWDEEERIEQLSKAVKALLDEHKAQNND